MGDTRTGPGGTLLQGTVGMDTAELRMAWGPRVAPGTRVTEAPGGALDHLGGGVGSKGQWPQGSRMTPDPQVGTLGSKRTTDPRGHHVPRGETSDFGDSSFRRATEPQEGGVATPGPEVTPGPGWGPGSGDTRAQGDKSCTPSPQNTPPPTPMSHPQRVRRTPSQPSLAALLPFIAPTGGTRRAPKPRGEGTRPGGGCAAAGGPAPHPHPPVPLCPPPGLQRGPKAPRLGLGGAALLRVCGVWGGEDPKNLLHSMSFSQSGDGALPPAPHFQNNNNN